MAPARRPVAAEAEAEALVTGMAGAEGAAGMALLATATMIGAHMALLAAVAAGQTGILLCLILRGVQCFACLGQTERPGARGARLSSRLQFLFARMANVLDVTGAKYLLCILRGSCEMAEVEAFLRWPC